MRKEKLSYGKALYSALDHLLTTDDRVVFLGEDIGAYGGAFGISGDLQKRHPARVISTPISEGGFTGVGVGLAMTGFNVVVEIMFMDFLTLAMDQLVNHAANVHYMYGGQLKCSIVVRTPAGGYRGYGPSHSKALESCLMSVPGIKIVAPSTATDAYGCLLSAVYDNNPVLFVEHKLLYNMEEMVDPSALAPVPLGRARVAREGSDVTVAAHSWGVTLALEAAKEMEGEGVSVEVLDLRTLKPLDVDGITESVRKTGRLVCVEEGNVFGGVGAEVASTVMENCLEYIDGRMVRVGKPDVPIPASTAAEKHLLPDAGRVVAAIKRSLSWR